MNTRKILIFKVMMTTILVSAILGMFIYVIIKGDLKYNLLSVSCIGAAFILSLIFINKSPKKLLITLALALTIAGEYFLIVQPAQFENSTLIGLCIFCGVQFAFLLYSLFASKAVGYIVINLAIRVLLCLLAYFILPNYIKLDTLELISLMYMINLFVTILMLCFRIKTNYILLLGLLLIFISNFCLWMPYGGIEMLKITGKFAEILLKYNFAYYFFIPGVTLVACASVWDR